MEEEITEVGRPFSVGLRARPEAVCGQSGLMLRAVSFRGSKRFGGPEKTLSVTPAGDQTES